MKNFIQKCKNIVTLILRINDKDLMTYASSLSFHTILSVIPVLLITFSIFTKMPSFEEYYENIKSFIFNSLMPSQSEMISEYIDKFLGNTIQMGIFGITTVLIISMMFFKDYEAIFNKIMHTSSRSFWQSLAAYWTLITLAPIFLGISFYMSNALQDFLNSQGYNINFLAIFPYIIVWALFFTIYMISSNAKISLYAGSVSSFLASFIWYISKTLFVFYVTYNKTYLTIYGSFSIVLFFFIWIYCSWIIFLYGVKVCYILRSREQEKREIANAYSGHEKHENSSVDAKNGKDEIDS
ncbi:MAG: YihY family inner membrane protein [Campylobacteraceae bacterium]|jgi:membrane protein|nr:YihY family inner membrane protein [Campylobacteraceae bacterium]